MEDSILTKSKMGKIPTSPRRNQSLLPYSKPADKPNSDHEHSEKDITSVKIKKEKLIESNQANMVSPDSRVKRRPKTDRSLSVTRLTRKSQRGRSPTPTKPKYVKHKKDTVMESDTELEECVKMQVNKENVFAFVKNTDLKLLMDLDIKVMKQVVSSWYELKNKPYKFVQSQTIEVLKINLEDVKEESCSEVHRQQLGQEIAETIRKETQAADAMVFQSDANIDDIKKYSHEDLCAFLYHKSGMIDKNVNTMKVLKSKHTDEILAVMLQYVQSIQPCSKSKDEQNEVPIRLIHTMKEKDISSMKVELLRKMYHQYTVDVGIPIPFSTIAVWPKAVLDDILKSKLKELQTKELKKPPCLGPTKSKMQSMLRKDSKYQGKKLVQTNLIGKNSTLNTCRYSIALTIPDKYKGTEGLRSYLSDIFNEMVNYGDEQFCLLPWNTDAIVNKIQDPDDLPTKITELKKYFNGARSPESSSYIYTKIRLGFAIGFDKVNFDADIQGWCKNKSIRLYECSVQHPNVRSCGWLAYMPRTVNQVKWCKAVTQLYNSINRNKTMQEFQIGLTWRILNGQRDVTDKNQKLRAMHVDAPVEIATRVKRFLRTLSHKKTWVLGVKFRMMDEFHQYMRPDMKQKYRYMVSKHRALMKQLGFCDCTQIINLDCKVGNSSNTVRDIVINLRDKQDNFRIFGSIDEKWNSDTVFTATYRPDKASKAYDFMRSLATYTQYLYPDANLKRIFTFDAIEKAQSEKYNPDTQTFTTQDDNELDREIQADLEDDSLGYLECDELEHPFVFDESINLVGGESTWDFTGDAETVSTGAGTKITFDKANMRYYDVKSCASSVASSNASVASQNKSKITVGAPDPIQEEIGKLDIAAASQDTPMNKGEEMAASTA